LGVGGDAVAVVVENWRSTELRERKQWAEL
jgi:hypothetical protein